MRVISEMNLVAVSLAQEMIIRVSWPKKMGMYVQIDLNPGSKYDYPNQHIPHPRLNPFCE